MIDYLGTSPSLRKAIWVVMATMHFHIVQTGSFSGKIFLHSAGPLEQIGTNSKLSLRGIR